MCGRSRLYLPFWFENFFEMVFSLNLLEKRGWFEVDYANICILKAILESEVFQNGL